MALSYLSLFYSISMTFLTIIIYSLGGSLLRLTEIFSMKNINAISKVMIWGIIPLFAVTQIGIGIAGKYFQEFAIVFVSQIVNIIISALISILLFILFDVDYRNRRLLFCIICSSNSSFFPYFILNFDFKRANNLSKISSLAKIQSLTNNSLFLWLVLEWTIGFIIMSYDKAFFKNFHKKCKIVCKKYGSIENFLKYALY